MNRSKEQKIRKPVYIVRSKKTDVDWIIDEEEVEVRHDFFDEVLKYAAVNYYVMNASEKKDFGKIYVR